jgi:protein-S-isoprenylcysteine O-methyltransferase Ste14
MPETEVVELKGRPPRSRGGGHGGCLVVFALPFLAAGAAIAAVGLGYFQAGPADAPRPVIGGVGVLFFLAGLLVAISGVKAMLAARRTARLMRERPHEPWIADHSWNPKGERERPFSKAVSGLFGLGFFALFLAPFNWWAVTERECIVVAIVGLFDLLLVGGIGFWIYEILRALKYGAAWVKFDVFPFFLGAPLNIRLGARGRLDRFQTLTVTVRFVRERYESRGDSQTAVCYQHWAEVLRFDPRHLRMTAELPIVVQLPSGDYGTWLSDTSASYWEVEMKGEAPGIDFESHFLLPVYTRR